MGVDGTAQGFDPAFEGLDAFRIAVSIDDPKGLLELTADNFQLPLRGFFAREGVALREMLSAGADDYLAIILDAGDAMFMDVPIGVSGTMRLALYRKATVRRTGIESDVQVWEQGLGYFVAKGEEPADVLLVHSRLLLQRFQRSFLQMPPVPEEDIIGAPIHNDPCPPFRPHNIRLSARLADPDLLVAFSPLAMEAATRQLLETRSLDVHRRLDPLGDSRLEFVAACRNVFKDDILYGISGSVRARYLEPVRILGGRRCVPGITWSKGIAFFVDKPHEAEVAVGSGLETLVGMFADDSADVLVPAEPGPSEPPATDE